jgi:hypothetical protein
LQGLKVGRALLDIALAPEAESVSATPAAKASLCTANALP